jgi:hypothetical protein
MNVTHELNAITAIAAAMARSDVTMTPQRLGKLALVAHAGVRHRLKIDVDRREAAERAGLSVLRLLQAQEGRGSIE